MSKGKYFLKTLGKAINANKIFLDGKEIELVNACCDGNEVSHADGSFVCEAIKMEMNGKEKIAHLFTVIDEKLMKTSKKVVKKTAKKKAKKVAKKTAKKVAKKTAKKVAKKIAKKVAKKNN